MSWDIRICTSYGVRHCKYSSTYTNPDPHSFTNKMWVLNKYNRIWGIDIQYQCNTPVVVGWLTQVQSLLGSACPLVVDPCPFLQLWFKHIHWTAKWFPMFWICADSCFREYLLWCASFPILEARGLFEGPGCHPDCVGPQMCSHRFGPLFGCMNDHGLCHFLQFTYFMFCNLILVMGIHACKNERLMVCGAFLHPFSSLKDVVVGMICSNGDTLSGHIGFECFLACNSFFCCWSPLQIYKCQLWSNCWTFHQTPICGVL